MALVLCLLGEDILTQEEIEAVAYYIFNSTKQVMMKLYKNKKIKHT